MKCLAFVCKSTCNDEYFTREKRSPLPPQSTGGTNDVALGRGSHVEEEEEEDEDEEEYNAHHSSQ